MGTLPSNRLRSKCWQTSSTEQLLHQTDKNSHWRCSIKKQSLRIPQYSQPNTCVLESLFNKVVCLKAWSFIRNRLQHRCFPVAKFLRKSILKNASELILGSDYLELCFWTFAFKIILTQ